MLLLRKSYRQSYIANTDGEVNLTVSSPTSSPAPHQALVGPQGASLLFTPAHNIAVAHLKHRDPVAILKIENRLLETSGL